MNETIVAGSTDVSVDVQFLNADGTPADDLAYNTSGLEIWYCRDDGASAEITLADLANEDSAHTDGGFKHRKFGCYRLCLPDAVIAAGASNATLMGGGDGVVMVTTKIAIATMSAEDLANTLGTPTGESLADDIADVKSTIPSVGAIADQVWDESLSGHTDAGSAGQRLGRIPNAASGGNGGLPTVDANNRIAGIQGTINTLDALDTAQDTQHSATMARLGTPSGSSLSADIAAVKGQTAAIESGTQNIQTRLPDALVNGKMSASMDAVNGRAISGTGTSGDPFLFG